MQTDVRLYSRSNAGSGLWPRCMNASARCRERGGSRDDVMLLGEAVMAIFLFLALAASAALAGMAIERLLTVLF